MNSSDLISHIINTLYQGGKLMDPVSAIAAASAAFGVIKKGFEVGRDIESMYGDIGRWMSAVSDINQAEKMAKNPPLFKKIAFKGSVEEEALEAFAAKKKAEQMRTDLKNLISWTRGPSAWDELLRMEAKIRKDRQKQIYDQQEARRKFFEYSAAFILVLVTGALMTWLGWLVVNSPNFKAAF